MRTLQVLAGVPASLSHTMVPHSTAGASAQGAKRITASRSAVIHRPLASSGPAAWAVATKAPPTRASKHVVEVFIGCTFLEP